MPIKKIILHVGIPKTGSSSIQESLFFNAKRLNDEGILFLTAWDANQSLAMFNLFSENPYNHHFNINYGLDTKQKVDEYRKEITRAFEAEISATSCHTLVISAENIGVLNKEDITRLKDFFYSYLGEVSFHVIAYVRDPVRLAVSLYQQMILQPVIDHSFSVFVNSIYNGYYQLQLEALLDAFGQTITVYKFEDALTHPQGLVGHFFERIGLDFSPLFWTRRTNDSRCTEVVEFLIFLQERLPYILVSAGNTKYINPDRSNGDINPLLKISGARFDFSFEEKQYILQQNAQDILWLQKHTGISYNLEVSQKSPPALYSQGTLLAFDRAFPRLSLRLKEIFLLFFEKKYYETQDERFLPLFEKNKRLYNTYQFALEFVERPKKTHLKKHEPNKSMPEDFAQLFINYNDGFYFEHSYKYFSDSDSYKILLKLDAKYKVRHFRIDPSLYPCASIVRLKINQKENNFRITDGNYEDSFGNTSIFLTENPQLFYKSSEVIETIEFENTFAFFVDDPQIYFESPEPITSIEAELIIDSGTYAFSHCAKFFAASANQKNLKDLQVQSLLQQQIEELTGQLTVLKEKTRSTEVQLQTQTQKYHQLQTDYQALLGSNSWKMTSPLRAISHLLKGNADGY